MLGRPLTWLLDRLHLPGTLYTSGKYRYLANATIFPARNAHLVEFPKDISLHDALFNAWDRIVLDQGVVLGHQVMFLSGRHPVDWGEFNPRPLRAEAFTFIAGPGSEVARLFWAGSPSARAL